MEMASVNSHEGVPSDCPGSLCETLVPPEDSQDRAGVTNHCSYSIVGNVASRHLATQRVAPDPNESIQGVRPNLTPLIRG